MAALFFKMAFPGCLDNPCQSEGVDDSTVAYASDYFIAVASFLFGVDLIIFRQGVRLAAILAQIFMAGCFCLQGLISAYYGNNGVTDGKGMKNFWILTAIASYALAFSAGCHASFSIQAADCMGRLREKWCSFVFTRILSGMVCPAAAMHIFGCISTRSIQTPLARDFKRITCASESQAPQRWSCGSAMLSCG